MSLPFEDQQEAIKRLGAYAAMVDNCSALIIIHLDDESNLKYSRFGCPYAQIGALEVFSKGIRSGLVNQTWDPDNVENE